jgi:large subunit ribosomal protein L28
MARCEICLRSGQTGNNVSHSKRRTKRRMEANIQRTTIFERGEPRRVNICTRCIRTQVKSSIRG